jgi:hypothetical protein
MKDTGAFVYVVDDDASAGDSSLTILRQEPGAFARATSISSLDTKNSHHESGGSMDLKESKFHYAGQGMNFVVFSDSPCQVRYVGSIRLPINLAPVEIYTIEPASNGQWGRVNLSRLRSHHPMGEALGK